MDLQLKLPKSSTVLKQHQLSVNQLSDTFIYFIVKGHVHCGILIKYFVPCKLYM